MYRVLVFFLFVCVLQSCSEYAIVVKADDYKRKFEVANKLYDKESYVKASTLYEQVYQRTPKTGEGELSYYRLGLSYFKIEDYYTAAYYLASFSDKYPNSIKCEETSFLNAICAVKNSPKTSLDQQETQVALNELQLFIYKFPNTNKLDTCNQIMDKLRMKLDSKDFESLQLYDKTQNFKSAVVVAETYLKDFPKSIYREQAWEILLRNSYLLAINSIEEKKKERIEQTNERYSKFALEYPQSVWLKPLGENLEKLKEIKF